MAVEAQHMNLLPSQLITDRPNQEVNNTYNNSTQMHSGLVMPMMTQAQTLLPSYHSFVDPVSGQTSLDIDNGLTSGNYAARKRPRDSMNALNSLVSSQEARISSVPSFLVQDITDQMQLQQSDIDLFIAQQAKKLRFEIAEQRKHQTRMLVSTIREAIMNKLKEKDEAIQRMTKLNWDLQERVKSLHADNELWRNMAQSSEAKASTLRANLEQFLAQATYESACRGTVQDDAESCCQSNDCGRENAVADGCCSGGVNRMCKMCGVNESSVLLLPCRHLCLCTMCGSTMQTCPVCKSFTSASVHVNMS